MMNSILHLIEKLSDQSSNRDDLICMLSLVCMICILSRREPSTAVVTESAPNPIQSLLGQLATKADKNGSSNGPSLESLLSLLPLLSNTGAKSQLNPGSLGTILGLLNNLNNGGPEKTVAAKQESPVAEKEA